MIIRQASKKDMPAIQEIIKMFPKQLMQDHLPKPSEFFVAVKKGRIVACCALQVYSKRLAEIRSLAVLKKLQGQGIGKRLVEECLKRALEKQIYEVLAITNAVEFFEPFGLGPFKEERYAVFKVLAKK